MQHNEKHEQIEYLKVLAIKLAQLYNSNIQLQIDVNYKLGTAKVIVKESFS